MKEKIYNYLKERDQGITSQEISERFLHTVGHYPPKTDRIIESLLQDDPRFVRDEIGEWHVLKKEESEDLADIVFSIIEIETIPIDSKHEVPVLLGIARIKNKKIVSQQIFSLDPLTQFSPPLLSKINQLQENLTSDQAFNHHVETIFQDLDQTIIISFAPSRSLAIINYYFRNQIGSELEAPSISLVSLARQLIPGIKIRSIEDIANSLSMSYHSPLDLKNRLNLTGEILLSFLHELRQSKIQTLTDLRAFIESAKTWVDFSSYHFNQDLIRSLPTTPGVYLMKNGQGKIFYVGKAKNLKSRVESYFVDRFEMDEKGRAILDRIVDLDYEPVGSELEALLLENRYINEFQPDLNTQINIRPQDFSKSQTKQNLVFLPGVTEDEIVIFLVNGVSRMGRVVISRTQLDEKALRAELKSCFFAASKKKSSFSPDQIEIFWRWFTLHKDEINSVDVATCGNLDECLQLVKKYCGDNRLFFEKIFYR